MEATESNQVPPPINQLQNPGTITFTIPSNFQVTIRETNGEDETNLSRIKNAKTGEAMAIFLAGIIIATTIPGQEKPTATQVQAWKCNDKYYCLLKSRMFSLGDILKFKWVWPEDPNPVTYTEDLKQFDRDLSKDSGDDSNDRTKIRMYPLREAIGREIQLSSGKKIRYEFLTGVGEKQSLDIPENETNNNTELIIRNLQWYNDQGIWINIENFGIFSSREMVAIRKDIIDHDIRFEMQISIENPYTGKMNYIPAIIINDFFYPAEI